MNSQKTQSANRLEPTVEIVVELAIMIMLKQETMIRSGDAFLTIPIINISSIPAIPKIIGFPKTPVIPETGDAVPLKLVPLAITFTNDVRLLISHPL